MARRALWLLFGSLVACHEPSAASPLEASKGGSNPSESPTAGNEPREGTPSQGSSTPARDAADAGSASEPTTPALEKGDLAVTWKAGSANCAQNQDPPLEVHAYNTNR